jgi:transposase-like protein
MARQRRFMKGLGKEAACPARTGGRTRREIAGDLGIGLSTRVCWIGRSRDGRAIDPAAAESEATAELKRPRRENKTLLAGAGHRKEGHCFFRPGGKSVRVALSEGRQRHSPSTACAACSVSAKAAMSPGEVGQLAADATTGCCWGMSGRSLPSNGP